jgi:hypothetical protein
VQGRRSKHDLPSWVPDWNFPYASHVLGHEKDPSKRQYKASLGQIANVVFKIDPEPLVVEGKVFDRVLKVGLPYNIDGDVVAILLGSSVPFILREQGTQFTLVGECYVHGVMKGEMLEDPSAGLETLCII